MAKVIMVQGTMSNAGKSLLVAGLCRIFKQDGYKVAPFKSQNMALNSYITKDGLEMGRAQVMQAEAAGIEPSVLMNPILLKPTSDVGSQVIVNGIARQNMRAREYFKYKKQLIPDILEAYNELAKDKDIIVIEGAGSPAEINLKSEDIVNMGLAKMLKAPVLLAGDIDRGGVFAQLAGTMLLLEAEEKNMVKGLIINKFRGDKTILDPGIEMLKDYTPVPVVGVVPYMHVDIDDEDSLAERLDQKDKKAGILDIAVIRIPRISNFTDFNALERLEGVSLRYVDKPSDLAMPDMIILPGTKNTMGDLKWLRSSGMENMILKQASSGTLIFGICGGYQMLGEQLEDPDHVEEGGQMRGMGLLPIRTVFDREKVTTRVEGKVISLQGDFAKLNGTEFEGYEIHMGNTCHLKEAGIFSELETKSSNEEGKVTFDGCSYENACGSYVHGLFDSVSMQQALIRLLLQRKGLPEDAIGWIDEKSYKEEQYDLLAKGIRENMDMDAVYRIIEEGL